MRTVGYILRTKGNTALAVDPSQPVRDALRIMFDNTVGSLLVVEEGRVVGLFTERDFSRSVALHGESSLDATVADVIEGDILYVSSDTSLDQCMALMTEKRTRHLPVIDDDELVGIVSIGDIVKELIEDKDFVIEQLERYITGR